MLLFDLQTQGQRNYSKVAPLAPYSPNGHPSFLEPGLQFLMFGSLVKGPDGVTIILNPHLEHSRLID